MSADTAVKRLSAINIGSPWRGLNVFPSDSSQGARQSVIFLYDGFPLVEVATTGGGSSKRRRKIKRWSDPVIPPKPEPVIAVARPRAEKTVVLQPPVAPVAPTYFGNQLAQALHIDLSARERKRKRAESIARIIVAMMDDE